MANGFDENLLFRRWIHAHEEDSAGAKVYRPAEYPFPPSRGRGGFELRPDGTALRVGPGPTDRPEQHQGTWCRAADGTVELQTTPGAPPRKLSIESVDAERLVVRDKDS